MEPIRAVRELSIPKVWKNARWKVKIREKEIREPPHVTLLKGVEAWRIDLWTSEFLDRTPDPGEAPKGLVKFILEEENWRLLRDE